MANPIRDSYQTLIQEIQSGTTPDRVTSIVQQLLKTDPNILELKRLEQAVIQLKNSESHNQQIGNLDDIGREVFQLIHLDYPSKMVAVYNEDRDKFLALLDQIDDPKMRYEIAKMCVAFPYAATWKRGIKKQKTPATFVEDIKYFKIENEEERAELGYRILDQKTEATLDDYHKLIQAFDLISENGRSLLLAHLVDKCDDVTFNEIINHLSDFGIEQESNRAQIASRCAYRLPELVIASIDCFQLSHPYLLSVYEAIGCLNIELLSAHRELLKLTDDEFEKIVISNYAMASDYLIDYVMDNYLNFSSQTQVLLIPLLVKHHPAKIFELISKYPLDQALLIVIGKEMSQTETVTLLMEKFDSLGLRDESARFEILKEVNYLNLSSILTYPERYQIKNPDFLLQLYQIIGKKAPHFLVDHAYKLPIEEERVLLAKAMASSNPHFFFSSLLSFHLSREFLIDLVGTYAYTLADYLPRIFDLLKLDRATTISVIKSNPLPSQPYFEYLAATYQTSENLLSLEVIEEILCCCADRDGAQTIELLYHFIGILDKKQLIRIAARCAKKILPENHDLIEMICKEASGYPNLAVILNLLHRFFVGTNPIRFARYKMLVAKPNKPPITHLLLPMLQVALWADTIEESALSQLRDHLSGPGVRDQFRNTGSTLQKLWLSTLNQLDQEPILQIHQRHQQILSLLTQITQQLDPKNPAHDLTSRIASLQGILNTKGPDQSSQDEMTQLLENLPNGLATHQGTITPYLEQLFEQRLRKDPYLDLEGIDNLSIKYARTFGSTRIPGALQIYEHSLKKHGDPSMRAPFNHFMRAVLNDTFSTARYAADTPHKEYLATRCRDAWLKWETSLQDISLEVAGDSPPPMIFREFAQVKLHEGRFENHLSQFANYLKTGTVPEPLDPIDDALIRLCQHQPINQDKLLTQLNEVEKLVSSLKGIPFAHDLHALKTNLMQPTPVRRYRITNTDHWELLLYSGTDVRSCQSLDTAGFNRGLLGTLLDGSCRMVAIIDPVSRKIVARSMIRLLIHEATQQPVIFQEPLYPQPCRANLASALNQFTLTVAQEMGLPLYREDRSITDDSVLNTLIHQGGSLLQYTDAGGGLVKGRFFIPQAIEVIPK